MDNNNSALIQFYPATEEEIQTVQEWKKRLRILNIPYRIRLVTLIKEDNLKLEKEVKKNGG